VTRALVLTLVAALTVTASTVAARKTYLWTTTSPLATWHYSDNGGVNIISEQAGVTGWVDPTLPVDTGGGAPPTQIAPYRTINLAGAGIPSTAKAVQLAVKTIITKGPVDFGASVFVFARRYGSTCCAGPPGYQQQPIDWNVTRPDGTVHPVEGMVGQAVAQLARDTVRQWTTVVVPVSQGRFQYSWGYRKAPGMWPDGDAVGVGVMVTGWLG
jgi:hypothetical protein